MYSNDQYYPKREDALMAMSEALNEEHHALADAGCPLIQIEEPALHFNPGGELGLSQEFYVEALNREVRGLRDKTEVWCHTCWGNPFAQRVEAGHAYASSLPYLDQLEVDVITFETAANGGEELAEIAAALGTDKKICIGVVQHRNLAVETADEVAALIRRALEHV